MCKVGTHRGGDREERVLVGRAHAEERLGCEREWAEVEARTGRGRNPVAIGLDERRDRADKILHRHLGDHEPAGGTVHALGVLVRAEGPHASVRVGVGLHPLEDLLPVVQHRRRGHQGERTVGLHGLAVPALTLGVGHARHVVSEVHAKGELGHRRPAARGGRRRGVRHAGEAGCQLGGEGECHRHSFGARRATIASPTSEVDRGEDVRAARSVATASSTRTAASSRPRWRSRRAIERIVAVGSAFC